MKRVNVDVDARIWSTLVSGLDPDVRERVDTRLFFGVERRVYVVILDFLRNQIEHEAGRSL